MKENMIHNLSLYFPFICKQGIDKYIINKYHTMTIYLKNGDKYLYNDTRKTIRRLPVNASNLTEEQYRIEFADRLFFAMLTRGVTQEELADKLGISQTTISQYLNSKRTPSFYMVDRIAKALDCSTDDLRYFE